MARHQHIQPKRLKQQNRDAKPTISHSGRLSTRLSKGKNWQRYSVGTAARRLFPANINVKSGSRKRPRTGGSGASLPFEREVVQGGAWTVEGRIEFGDNVEEQQFPQRHPRRKYSCTNTLEAIEAFIAPSPGTLDRRNQHLNGIPRSTKIKPLHPLSTKSSQSSRRSHSNLSRHNLGSNMRLHRRVALRAMNDSGDLNGPLPKLHNSVRPRGPNPSFLRSMA
jgi:hypothetical protein